MNQRSNIVPPPRLVTLGKRIRRQQLKAGYLANAEHSLEIARDWFPPEEEASDRDFAARK